MLKLLRVFFEAPGTRPWSVLGALLLAGVVEGLGIASLLPVISIAVEDMDGPRSQVGEIMGDLLGKLGLSIELGPLLLFLVAMLILKSLVMFLAMRHVGYAAANVATEFRLRLIRALLDVRYRYLLSMRQGQIANGMAGHAGKAGETYVSVATFIALGVQSLFYVAIAFVVSPAMAVAALVMGALIGGLLHPLVKLARRSGQAMRFRSKELMVFLSDTLGNIKPIKAMARQAPYGDLIERKAKALRRALKRQATSKELLVNVQDAIMAVILCGGFYVVFRVFEVPITEIIVTGLLLTRTASIAGKLQKAYQRAVLVESHYFALSDMIAEAKSDPEPNPGRETPRFEQKIRFEDVSFSHDRAPVVHDLSLTVQSGTVTVLLGPSGAGKTTIVDLLLGLHQPDAGHILVDGTPLREIDLGRWRRLIGYVPQEPTLLHSTIRDNITLGDTGLSDADIMEALRTAHASHLMDELADGLDTIVGERGGRLSGGQRQRIALARALVHRPKLLILDEVTSALDPASEREVCENIRQLGGRLTVLAITHRPAWLDVADEVFEIAGGRATRLERPEGAASMAGAIGQQAGEIG
ncbi:ABC transporter ATP-binding protein [Marinimicrococcus flavescens]|uniref:ABC transporter ATP-binding protein n=1 Tax=Marinimicrococcus flavescens TaxID=3031815 RepID=A0AAP3V042_9PROT|nr:ABC transporter ATP-binding protein [Marinimicrococcus flavescens]